MRCQTAKGILMKLVGKQANRLPDLCSLDLIRINDRGLGVQDEENL